MPSFPVQRAVASLTFVMSFGLALPALAANQSADTASAIKLSPIEVSASRTAAQADVLPVGKVVISHDQLQKMPVSNLAGALRSVGGMNVSSFYGDATSGSYNQVGLMGFGATSAQNTLILLNGRRLNAVDSSSVNLSAIPLSVIDHIEILPGSGSVLYGNGAVGGVVNVVTNKHYDTAGRIEMTLGEQDTRGGAVQGSFGSGAVDGMLSLSRLGSDGYRDNNESWESHAFGSLRYTADAASYYMTVLGSKQELGLPGGISGTQVDIDPTQAATPDDWAKDKTVQVLPGMSYHLADNLDLYLDGGFRVRQREGSFFGGFNTIESTGRTLSLSPRLAGRFTVGLPQQWTAGVDYTRVHYNSDSTANGHERYERAIYAAYAQDSIGLTNSTWLTLGARHEWVRTKKTAGGNLMQGDPDQEVGMWSIGLRQQLSDSVSVFVKAERNARYATVDELRPNLNAVQNTPLKAQTGKLYTLGAKWQKGAQYSAVTVWQGEYSNEIMYVPGVNTCNYPLFGFSGACGANINLDDTKRTGISLNSYWKLQDNLWLALSGSYQNAEFDAGPNKGNAVPLVPTISGYARIDWTIIPSITFSLSERYAGQRHFDNDQDDHVGKLMEDYRWMDVSITWQPDSKEGVYVSAILHNAENREGAYNYGIASTTGSNFNAYPLPGRYLVVKAGVNF